MLEPRWEHDCPDCSFEGHLHSGDLYWCEVNHQWVVRRGAEGGDYLSCASMALEDLLMLATGRG